MQKNDELILKIEDMGVDGAGIGKSDGMTFFVKDAVIGDVVRAKIIKLKKTYGYARLMELLEASADRVEPNCPYYRQCGGCQIQALSYEKQLEFKENKVRNNLERIGGFTKIPMEPIVGMDEPYHYRNKAQFPVGTDKEGHIVTGFYAGRTHTIIPNRDCALGLPVNREILNIVIDFMEKYHISAYDEKTGKGLVRHVLIRCGFSSQEKMVCLIINGKSLPHGEKLVEELLSAMEGTFNRNDYQSVFPEGLTAAVSTLKDGRLTIDFNDAYKQMDDTREVLLRAAVVQTMTQITDVREVVFTVAGEALLNSENQAVGPMHASSFINSEGDSINAYQYEALPLYFGSRNGTSLTKQMRNVHYASDDSLEKLVVEQLIAGPAGSKLTAVVPSDTVVREIRTEGDLCTVNLSSEFNQAVAGSSVTPEVTVYAIVNSICESCEDITKVQIQVEGSSDVLLRDTLDLSQVFSCNSSFIREKDGENDTGSSDNGAVPSVGVDPNLTKEAQTESGT